MRVKGKKGSIAGPGPLLIVMADILTNKTTVPRTVRGN